jgi:hypothetical protein
VKALFVLLVAGCGPVVANTAPGVPVIARRATYELGCAVSESNVTDLGEYQYGVDACGCRAVYVGNVLNSVSGEACRVTTGGESR